MAARHGGRLFRTRRSNHLKKLHCHAASAIAGIPRGASRDDALKEARLDTLESVVHRRSIEYYLNSTTRGGHLKEIAEDMFTHDHPFHEALRYVEQAYSAVDDFSVPHFSSALWIAPRVYFNTTAPGGLTADAPDDEKHAACVERVSRFIGAHYTLWTGGSVTTDVHSGSAALLYKKNTLIGTRQQGVGPLACSYRTECVAMEIGHQLLLDTLPHRTKPRRTQVAVFTDSLSLLSALKTGPLR